MLEKLRALMSRKIAGVPILYFVGFGVAVLAVYAYQTQVVSEDQGDDPLADTDPTTENSADGDPDSSGQPTFTANPSNPPVTANPDSNSPITVDSNELWAKRAIEWLVQTGQANGGTASNVINKYLAGDTLSYAEGALRDAAIKQYGIPPEPPLSTPTGARPATRQFTSFPGTHTVKGASDNTYGELSQLYYGRNDGLGIDLIQGKNRNAGSGGPFPIGTKIIIPKWQTPKYYRATSARNTASAIAKANGISIYQLEKFNDTLRFPVKVGTRVRVG